MAMKARMNEASGMIKSHRKVELPLGGCKFIRAFRQSDYNAAANEMLFPIGGHLSGFDASRRCVCPVATRPKHIAHEPAAKAAPIRLHSEQCVSSGGFEPAGL